MVLERRLAVTLIFSLVIHVACLLLLPDFLPTPKFRIIPVTLLTPVDILITKGAEGWEGHPVIEEITEQIWKGFTAEFPLELPAAQPKGVELLDVEKLLGPGPLPPRPKEPVLGTPPVFKPKVKEGILSALKEELKPEKIKKEEKEKKPTRPRPLEIGIKGPVASRRLLYTPPPPRVKISVETEVVLKFWVRPDGTVGRVIPLRKGDARLEAAGMEYLKGCLFEPLPPEAPQVEQWGTLSVKSVLR